MRPLFVRAAALDYLSLFLLVLSVALLFLSPNTVVESWTRANLKRLAFPILSVVSLLDRSFGSVHEALRSRAEIVRENEALTLKLRTLVQTQRELERIQRLNATYESRFKSASPVLNGMLFARVISYTLGNQSNLIWIDRGRSDGLSMEDIAFNSTGLLGRVIHLNQDSAEIMLLTDYRHGLSVIAGERHESFNAFGTGEPDRLRITTVLAQHGLKLGDKVYTSGLGGVYPVGYEIGRVVSIEKDPSGPNTNIDIETQTDFRLLDYVALVRHSSRALSAPPLGGAP